MRWLAGLLLLIALSVLADIRQTPHALARNVSKADAMEICVFCHTPTINIPEGGLQRIKPAWQHALPENHSFTLYDDIGRAQFADKPSVGSQSIACLSCHDANQAFSVTNFSYDHPFGVPYRGFLRGKPTSLQPGKPAAGDDEAPSVAAKRLMGLDDFKEPSSATVDNRVVWWVSSGANPGLRSRNDLPLYARRDLGSGGEIPYIECSSCHDPHTTNPLFLRVPAQGSKLCLTCHTK